MRICEVCKKMIEPERAELLLDTHLCTQHGREIERYGGEFKVSMSQERTSKPGSLKINYGGVSTRKKRNQRAIDSLREDFLSQGDDTYSAH